MSRFEPVTFMEKLEEIYGQPAEASLVKVADRITREYRRFLEASPGVAIDSYDAECAGRAAKTMW